MLDHFITFIKTENLFNPEQKILLAVSGGIDSVALTDLFYRAGFSFAIAHANFGLRGGESTRDEEFVRSLADKYGVEIFVRNFDTAGYAIKKKISIQVAARELRYTWFDELLQQHGFACVATAHHLDDQVETFLINLTRGTGIAGLHGIPVQQRKIIRPMLFTQRKEIESYAFANHLEFAEDSSNKSLKYTRNRIRHKVIPQLEKINPGFKLAVNETIEKIKDFEAIYRKTIEETRNSIIEEKGDSISIKSSAFYNLDPIETIAFELLSPFGFTKSQIGDIIGLRDSISGKEVISPTHRLIKDRDRLILLPIKADDRIKVYLIDYEGLIIGITNPVKVQAECLARKPEKFDDTGLTAYLDLDKLTFPLIIRKWERGDFFFPLGMTKQKKLSDFFIDLKYSKFDKENQWLLCSGNDIVWIIGKRIDDRFKIIPGTKKVLRISII
jgi:tRNA(Ile)-lysidine synthase